MLRRFKGPLQLQFPALQRAGASEVNQKVSVVVLTDTEFTAVLQEHARELDNLNLGDMDFSLSLQALDDFNLTGNAEIVKPAATRRPAQRTR